MGRTTKAVTRLAAPYPLTMNLFAPGMSALHRAGLGGLACTLKAMERHHKAGLIADDKLPAPFVDGKPSWGIDSQSVTLKFGKPEAASEYLEKLFAFAFQIRDGLIYLPGQYGDVPPSLAVRAEMQTALTRTFLQGAKKNVGLESSSPFFVDPDGSGIGAIEIKFQQCKWYLHQQLWKALVDNGSMLEVPKKKIDGKKNVNIGSLYPGAIKRHDSFNESDVSESVHGLLAALFFLVGCSVARLGHSGDGVLLIPEVRDLEEFASDRPFLTPRTVSEVRVGGAADAAYQAEVRLRSRSLLLESDLPSCQALRFALRTWTKPQKSRVDATEVNAEGVSRVVTAERNSAERSLDQFEAALAELPPRVRLRRVKQTVGTGRAKQRVEREECFWIDSTIRPHIATNLALGGRWYDRFDHLFRAKDTRRRVAYETRGLRAMATNRTLTDDEEAAFIAAMHRAIFLGRGRIYADTMGQDAAHRRTPANNATKKRWERFMERLRLGLVGAKTAGQVQSVINELLARNGTVKELRDTEAINFVRRILFGSDWLRARNLALFAVASYQRPPKDEPIPGDTEPDDTVPSA